MPRLQTTGPHATELYYVDQGQGQPVVLIHGWPLSHRMWESQITALTEAGYRCIAYDRRGFGESGRPVGGYDYDTFAADLDALMTQLDLQGAVLAGFSMGGGEVARYIGRHGTRRVAKAMLLGAVPPYLLKAADNPQGVDRSVFDGMLAGVKQDRIGFLAGFFPGFYNLEPGDARGQDLLAFSKWIAWAASPLATQQCIVAFGGTDFRDDLKKFDVPTCIVHGDSDRIVPVEVSGQRAQQMIRGSRLELLRGAPHGFAATHAQELNAKMLAFLKS
ncbi:alpha/beta fold hydrolase [Ramlibacter tataouinensis]|uniref:Candidate non-heme chloroperoxidase (Chloride peroxidase) n=1 Tax=Ramlibacter tataouinensis (strain ATCC BAA-407 / DSM 14655 / LMG 21543 / TTB310) TaxID=365046 RepID=F5Y2E3_RAMTT|nr:alpha/beta hydrolase [Ramlibacter tataouinensis]AEG91117.1 Candidate non-heme chloroperoxidase (Chloride peroxidase) [Ramlibacter tataouinensis TTB310]